MRSDRRDVVVDFPVKIVVGHGADERSFLPDLDPERPEFVTDAGVEVWLKNVGKSCRVRYVDVDGNQVGEIHPHVAGALVFARANGWRDPGDPDWWNDLCIAYTRELIAEAEAAKKTRRRLR